MNSTALIPEYSDDMMFQPAVIDNLLAVSITSMDNEKLMARLKSEHAFHLQATRMTREILTATTMAQTMSVESRFDDLLSGAPFSRRDQDLKAIGDFMMQKIAKLSRLPDDAIADKILQTRFKQVIASI